VEQLFDPKQQDDDNDPEDPPAERGQYPPAEESLSI
jgi:hypothetical protein